jgi:hypothetical protein
VSAASKLWQRPATAAAPYGSMEGYCEETSSSGHSVRAPSGLLGSACERDHKGTWQLPMRRGLDRWERSVEECLTRCSLCDRCAFISVSPRFGDCSWFAACNVRALHQRPSGFRTGRAIPLPAGRGPLDDLEQRAGLSGAGVGVLRCFARRLASGQPVTAAVLGTSISTEPHVRRNST